MQDESLRAWADYTQTAIEELALKVIALSEDMRKTNTAGLMENQMLSRVNDLVGLQAVQIRDLVRQVAQLDSALTVHLAEVGYSE